MSEKEKAKQEINRIERNKSITRADKTRAINQVKNLTRTIDGLIDREKDRISEHYESQLASQIRLSTLNQPPNPNQQTFHNGQELFALDRNNEEDINIKRSGSFLLTSSQAVDRKIEEEEAEAVEDSALYEQRPLLREDIQFDDFKPFKVQNTNRQPQVVETSSLAKVNQISNKVS